VTDVRALRASYEARGLTESDLAPDPFVQFGRWMSDASNAGLIQPDAMVLATAAEDGAPSARLVLLKSVADGGMRFFTHQDSAKGRELERNPRAALVFPWHDLQRQVRVTGTVAKLSSEECDSYFATRPRGAQIGAWASQQSRVIPDRASLDAAAAEFAGRFEGQDVPRPPRWGGYHVTVETMEFWQGRRDRLHDRLLYRREAGVWVIERLAP